MILERGPFSLVITIVELLGRKNRRSGLESREYGRKDHTTLPLSANVGTNFAVKRRSLGRYSSLVNSGQGVCFVLQWNYNKTQHTKIHISHKITHHSQIKHGTQCYSNNKGHITRNEYSTKSKAIPVTGGGGL
jgi:hypothetical protein